jgi:hypothetical protein
MFQEAMEVKEITSMYYKGGSEIDDFRSSSPPQKKKTHAATSRPSNKAKFIEVDEEDYLDVKFMEKSLDLRYKGDSSRKPQSKDEEDMLNVAALDEKLSKFSASQKSITMCKDT